MVLHGYGSHKEEVLGLGLALAKAGIKALVPDLPGHGKNLTPLTGESLPAFGRALKEEGFTWAVGHSLGGRLALCLDAHHFFLLSVPLKASFSGSRTQMLRVLRARWVREEKPLEGLSSALNSLPLHWPPEGMLLLAARDLATCREAAELARRRGWQVEVVKGTDHLNLPQAPATYALLETFIRERRERR
ncbi:alpha/beta fold hydrolase [Desulfothermobacter acidiphilus]|uniref:alpha/beta fold hydrolase n=1 Tax=Desulfothermobacter acidiphilus TaxID=1938353 RepID=UPI003F8AFC6D